MHLCEFNTYEMNIITLGVSLIMMVIAAVTLIVSVRSSSKTARDFNKLIRDTNRATRANISVEINKLEVEKFRLSMQMLDLEARKKKIFANPNGEAARHRDSARALIDEIDGQLDRCKKLHTEMGLNQLDMQKILDGFNS